MEKNVVISIKGRQRYVDNDADAIELVTEGCLKKENFGYMLTYQESEMTGLDGTITTILVDTDTEQVTMMREGEVNTQMVFRHGRRHMAMYQTPYGNMTIGVNARHVLIDLDEHGGDLELDYDIEIDHAVAGRNMFMIHVEESNSSSLKM